MGGGGKNSKRTGFVGYGAGLLGIGLGNDFGNGFSNDFSNDFDNKIATLTFRRARMAQRRERPADSRAWRRFLRRFWVACVEHAVAQNDAYYGWSWTPDTASWVEPTSYAFLVLRRFAPRDASAAFRDRLRVAESMLLDRMCPGGGWNCGNPMVYGAPGEAQIGPTVWALLALRRMPDRDEVSEKPRSAPEQLALRFESCLTRSRTNLFEVLRTSYCGRA